MIVLELNEFNPALLAAAAEQLALDNLRRLLALPSATTRSEEQRERGGLDPWVQWVSIHTGQPAAAHGVRHLAEAHRLEIPQIWEVLAARGVSSGVWGAMNAHRGQAGRCRFFFPDPWTWTEEPWPPELGHLLALPRFYAQNYLELSPGALLAALLRLARYTLRPRVLASLLPVLPRSAADLVRHRLASHVLFSVFDHVCTELFVLYCRRYRPDLKVLFLNSIAHLQHNCWHDPDRVSAEMAPSFRILDAILGRIFTAFPEHEPLLVVNAFSQRYSAEKNDYLYRQVNPEGFLQRAGIEFVRVEQMMTNDAHVFFATDEQAERGGQALAEARIDGTVTAFEVEQRRDAPCELFYQVDFWQELPSSSTLTINGRALRFAELFEKVVRRTGEHVPEGHVYARHLTLPAELMNHDVFKLIESHYAARG